MNTQDNARDFVEKLDQLIRERLHQSCGHATSWSSGKAEETCEVLKRDLTDFLLQADRRGGVYVKGPND